MGKVLSVFFRTTWLNFPPTGTRARIKPEEKGKSLRWKKREAKTHLGESAEGFEETRRQLRFEKAWKAIVDCVEGEIIYFSFIILIARSSKRLNNKFPPDLLGAPFR